MCHKQIFIERQFAQTGKLNSQAQFFLSGIQWSYRCAETHHGKEKEDDLYVFPTFAPRCLLLTHSGTCHCQEPESF